VTVKGLVHVTGGGLLENPPRILPEGVAMELRTGSWEVPPLFGLIQALGRVSDHEMWRVFNCGLGMLIVVDAGEVEVARAALGEARVVGRIVARGDRVGLPPVVMA
jgi:phosphoribosylformylglycinamidine cyclo-ligase